MVCSDYHFTHFLILTIHGTCWCCTLSKTTDILISTRVTINTGVNFIKVCTCNLQAQLLFSVRQIIATLVNYKCKTFIKLTPG